MWVKFKIKNVNINLNVIATITFSLSCKHMFVEYVEYIIIEYTGYDIGNTMQHSPLGKEILY